MTGFELNLKFRVIGHLYVQLCAATLSIFFANNSFAFFHIFLELSCHTQLL